MNRQVSTVVVTGVGAFSSIGKNIEETIAALRSGKTGIGPISLFDTTGLKIKHAAEVRDYDPLKYFRAEEAEIYDRTTQFGLIAAEEALANSGLTVDSLPSDRTAIVCGVCSGTFKLKNDEDGLSEEQIALRRLVRGKQFQTAVVAKRLGIHGPQASISTACASSSTALAYAYEILQSKSADIVLVGGTDGLLYLTYAGFYALGAMAEQPCSPFSENVGVSFGEGAGYVVLESYERARGRGAKIYGELAGYGSTSDAYHFTAPHPSGEGLRRAMEAALRRADATVEEIDYINAHGTGTRDNDSAESLAIESLCAGKRTPPPVSSTKSFAGHTLGAAGILEFITCLLAAQEQFLPPTVNFQSARAGCSLDYVPNKARPGKIDFFLSNSAAFGGVNTVVAGRRQPRAEVRSRAVPRIVITGFGVVSSAGCGLTEFRQALHVGRLVTRPIDRFDVSDCGSKYAGLVCNFNPRKLTPALDVRRLDLLTQYAAVSAGLAYGDACLTTQTLDPERTGAIVALAAGPVGTQQAFSDSLSEKGIEGVGAKHFPAIVVSTVCGQICQMLGLKGLNSTLCEGAGAGLFGAGHAYEMLRGSEREDRILAIAPDELNRTFFRHRDTLGLLADEPKPYDPESRGMTLSEGCFALVLERLESAQARGARIYAEILGYSAHCDAITPLADPVDDKWMRRSMISALENAATDADEISFAVGLANGTSRYDAAEREAFRAVLGESMPISVPARMLGSGLAGSGAAALTLGALGLYDKNAYLTESAEGKRPLEYKKSLVFGGSETGNYAAFVLGAAP